MDIKRSVSYFEEAKRLLPGGVDSPVRAFQSVGGQPLFIDRGQGPYIYDVDGNRFVDYVLSWGPLMLGHAHPQVVEALHKAVQEGTSFGAPSPLENQLAKLVQEFMPKIEMLRFVNSGTEATMTALRLARAYTGRDKIIKFRGCYHGHADLLLVQAGSGVATLGLPDSPGVPKATVQDTLVAEYNDLTSVESLFETFPEDIAAVIVEPVAGNMGVVPPREGFLDGLRDMTREHESVLIFDEVMTGFRVHPGGAQALYDIEPDLTTLGKVIGGGLPVGAYGGKREIMEMVAPVGPMYQAGTLSGNPLAMSAGIATLQTLKKDGVWEGIDRAARTLSEGIADEADAAGIPLYQTRVGTMFAGYFSEEKVTDWETASQSDQERFGSYFRELLKRGVYIAPSQFEAGFISSVHDQDAIEHTLEAVRGAFKHIKG